MAKLTTLKENCLKVVIDNIGLFIKDSTIIQLSSLPPTVKTDLFLLAIDKCEQSRWGFKKWDFDQLLCRILSILVNSTLITVHVPSVTEPSPPPGSMLTRMVNFCKSWISAEEAPRPKSNIQKLMEAIADAQCSGLRLLHLKTTYGEKPIPLMDDSDLGQTFFRALPRLTSLQVIQIDFFCCDDWALQQFGKDATNLIVLQVGLSSEVSSVGFQALTNLRLLRQFIFGNSMHYSKWQLHKKLLVLCWQNLPHLKVAGCSFNFLHADMFVTYLGSYNHRSYHDHLVQQQQLTKLSLESLCIGFEVQPHENLDLPELKSLSIKLPTTKEVFDLCDRFNTISALGIYCTELLGEDLITVLQSIGQRLRFLALDVMSSEQRMSLCKVLEICPNLQGFRFTNCFFNDTSNIWPQRLFSCLEEVNLDFENQHIPPGFAMQCLKSKKIKTIRITNCRLTSVEMIELITLVQQRDILHNIVGFECWNDKERNDSYVEQYELLINMLKDVNPQVKIF